jgi:endonuclease/exonuclease/phosphatase (EEP) superfamily protein YafD
MACKQVVILAVFLPPWRPLIGADLDACFGVGLPVLMAGDMNAKHVDWNSRLTTRMGKLLRDYADRNSCLVLGRTPQPPTRTTPLLLTMS